MRLESEVVHYAGKAGGELTGVERGADGTSPAPHAAGTVVDLVVERTFVRLDSHYGDYIGAGARRLLTADTGTFGIQDSSGGVAMMYLGYAEIFTFYFSSGTGVPLQVGSYDNAENLWSDGEVHPGLSVNGDGRGCNGTRGRFDVLEVEYEPASLVPRVLSVDFEQHCEGAAAALFGQIRFRSSLPVPTPPHRTLRVPGDYATIQEALLDSIDGDRIVVGPGDHEGPVQMDGRAVILESEAGPGTTVLTSGVSFSNQGRDTELTGFTIEGGVLVSSASPTISGNVVRAPGNGIWLGGGSALVVENVIEDGIGTGISAGGLSPEIRRNIIRRNRLAGVSLYAVGAAIVADNEISGNRSGGLEIHGASAALLSQNLIVDNTDGAGVSWHLATGEQPVLLVNNTIANNRHGWAPAIDVSDGGGTLRMLNNILVAAPGQVTLGCNGPGSVLLFSHNDAFAPSPPAGTPSCVDDPLGNGNLSLDPRFINPSAGDYHLAPDSPAIDAAADGFPPSDLDGRPRPIDGDGDGDALADLGAEEFDPFEPSATPTQTPLPPTPSATPFPTLPPAPVGAQCGLAGMCASGACENGYCCEHACHLAGQFCGLRGYEGTCLSVDLPPTPTTTPSPSPAPKKIGDPCSSDAACGSGFCREGLCCESDCPGSGEFCAFPGALGRCAAFDLPPTRTPLADPPPRGDENCDRATTAADLVATLSDIGRSLPAQCGGDANGDGGLSLDDVDELLHLLFR